jgi:hypothetical protein
VGANAQFCVSFFVGYGGIASRLLFLVAFGCCSALGYRLNSCRAFLKSTELKKSALKSPKETDYTRPTEIEKQPIKPVVSEAEPNKNYPHRTEWEQQEKRRPNQKKKKNNPKTNR